MLAPIPTLATLESNDDGQLTAELRLARLRAQVAVVRALADHIEHLAQPVGADELGEQLVEEMARLASQLTEAAASLKKSMGPEDSGVFPRTRAR